LWAHDWLLILIMLSEATGPCLALLPVPLRDYLMKNSLKNHHC